MKLFFWFCFLELITIPTVFSQTCCTGGVPFLGAFKNTKLSQQQFQFDLSYSYNDNSDLFQNDVEISGHKNYRLVHTLLMQTSYGISDRFTVSAIIPYLWQTEEVNTISQSESIRNQGIGDISVWASFWQAGNKNTYILSAGLKSPTGATNASNPDNGFIYPFSFQNGSGSWDFMFNFYDELSLEAKRILFWINAASVKINTKGNGFDAHPEYRFGHSFQYSSSLSLRWVYGAFLADGYIGMSYQYAIKDQFKGGFENENTGGNWLNLNLGYNHQFSPKLHAGISGVIPVFRDLNGLQLTTNKQLFITIGYTI